MVVVVIIGSCFSDAGMKTKPRPMAAEGRESLGEVVKRGYLRKVKQSSKRSFTRRYFVLRDGTETSPPALEYYDTEKKYLHNAMPKRSHSVDSENIIHIHKHTQGGRHLVSVYFLDSITTLVFDAMPDQDLWCQELLRLQREPPRYNGVWQLSVRQGAGRTAADQNPVELGTYRLCIMTDDLCLVPLGTRESKYKFEFPTIRSCGRKEHYIFLELGRSAVTGSGQVLCEVEDKEVAEHLHMELSNAMSNSGMVAAPPLNRQARQESKKKRLSLTSSTANQSLTAGIPGRSQTMSSVEHSSGDQVPALGRSFSQTPGHKKIEDAGAVGGAISMRPTSSIAHGRGSPSILGTSPCDFDRGRANTADPTCMRKADGRDTPTSGLQSGARSPFGTGASLHPSPASSQTHSPSPKPEDLPPPLQDTYFDMDPRMPSNVCTVAPLQHSQEEPIDSNYVPMERGSVGASVGLSLESSYLPPASGSSTQIHELPDSANTYMVMSPGEPPAPSALAPGLSPLREPGPPTTLSSSGSSSHPGRPHLAPVQEATAHDGYLPMAPSLRQPFDASRMHGGASVSRHRDLGDLPPRAYSVGSRPPGPRRPPDSKTMWLQPPTVHGSGDAQRSTSAPHLQDVMSSPTVTLQPEGAYLPMEPGSDGMQSAAFRQRVQSDCTRGSTARWTSTRPSTTRRPQGPLVDEVPRPRVASESHRRRVDSLSTMLVVPDPAGSEAPEEVARPRSASAGQKARASHRTRLEQILSDPFRTFQRAIGRLSFRSRGRQNSPTSRSSSVSETDKPTRQHRDSLSSDYMDMSGASSTADEGFRSRQGTNQSDYMDMSSSPRTQAEYLTSDPPPLVGTGGSQTLQAPFRLRSGSGSIMSRVRSGGRLAGSDNNYMMMSTSSTERGAQGSSGDRSGGLGRSASWRITGSADREHYMEFTPGAHGTAATSESVGRQHARVPTPLSSSPSSSPRHQPLSQGVTTSQSSPLDASSRRASTGAPSTGSPNQAAASISKQTLALSVPFTHLQRSPSHTSTPPPSSSADYLEYNPAYNPATTGSSGVPPRDVTSTASSGGDYMAYNPAVTSQSRSGSIPSSATVSTGQDDYMGFNPAAAAPLVTASSTSRVVASSSSSSLSRRSPAVTSGEGDYMGYNPAVGVLSESPVVGTPPMASRSVGISSPGSSDGDYLAYNPAGLPSTGATGADYMAYNPADTSGPPLRPQGAPAAVPSGLQGHYMAYNPAEPARNVAVVSTSASSQAGRSAVCAPPSDYMGYNPAETTSSSYISPTMPFSTSLSTSRPNSAGTRRDPSPGMASGTRVIPEASEADYVGYNPADRREQARVSVPTATQIPPRSRLISTTTTLTLTPIDAPISSTGSGSSRRTRESSQYGNYLAYDPSGEPAPPPNRPGIGTAVSDTRLHVSSADDGDYMGYNPASSSSSSLSSATSPGRSSIAQTHPRTRLVSSPSALESVLDDEWEDLTSPSLDAAFGGTGVASVTVGRRDPPIGASASSPPASTAGATAPSQSSSVTSVAKPAAEASDYMGYDPSTSQTSAGSTNANLRQAFFASSPPPLPTTTPTLRFSAPSQPPPRIDIPSQPTLGECVREVIGMSPPAVSSSVTSSSSSPSQAPPSPTIAQPSDSARLRQVSSSSSSSPAKAAAVGGDDYMGYDPSTRPTSNGQSAASPATSSASSGESSSSPASSPKETVVENASSESDKPAETVEDLDPYLDYNPAPSDNAPTSKSTSDSRTVSESSSTSLSAASVGGGSSISPVKESPVFPEKAEVSESVPPEKSSANEKSEKSEDGSPGKRGSPAKKRSASTSDLQTSHPKAPLERQASASVSTDRRVGFSPHRDMGGGELLIESIIDDSDDGETLEQLRLQLAPVKSLIDSDGHPLVSRPNLTPPISVGSSTSDPSTPLTIGEMSGRDPFAGMVTDVSPRARPSSSTSSDSAPPLPPRVKFFSGSDGLEEQEEEEERKDEAKDEKPMNLEYAQLSLVEQPTTGYDRGKCRSGSGDPDPGEKPIEYAVLDHIKMQSNPGEGDGGAKGGK